MKQDNIPPINYHKLGLENADKARGDHNQLEGSLDVIYHTIVKEAELTSEQKDFEVKRLNDEKNKLTSDFVLKVGEVKAKESAISLIGKEIQAILEGKGHIDKLPLLISSVLLILLTVFLWLFYCAIFYSTFNPEALGDNCGIQSIIKALERLFRPPFPVSKVLYFIIPTVFITLGYIIHDASKRKGIAIVAVLVLVTFLLDCIFGYSISNHINICVTEGYPYAKWTDVFQDLNFYLILFCGFVSYLMWGYMLNSTMKLREDMRPSVKQASLEREKSKLEIELIAVNAERAQLENEIKNIEISINEIERNVVFISKSKLNSNIGEFMSGWGEYIQTVQKYNNPQMLITSANNVKEHWLNNKFNSLLNNKGNVILKNN